MTATELYRHYAASYFWAIGQPLRSWQQLPSWEQAIWEEPLRRISGEEDE